jgi:anti-sigma B factor antagonist
VRVDDHRLSVERVSGGIHLFVLSGDLDLAGDRFEWELQRALDSGASAIVVDCSALTFLDTRTIDGLLAALRAFGERLLVVAPEGEIRRIFELTGLATVFRLHGSRAEALASLGADDGGTEAA